MGLHDMALFAAAGGFGGFLYWGVNKLSLALERVKPSRRR
jgi:hypothetical protein